MAQKTKNTNKIYKVAVAAMAIMLLLAVIVSLFRSCGDEMSDDTNDSDSGFTFDSSAVVGGWDEADIDKIVDSLNEKIEEGMINISMNTSPVFKDGTSEGNLMIVNEGINNYPQVVEITRNDTNEVIYKSGGIPVGSKIEKAKLTVDLPSGKYECTAMFHSVDPKTGASIGCAGAIITVTVQQ